MRLLMGILFQILYMGFASGAVFMFTSVVSPLKPVISHPSTHLPRMSIRFTEYSLPMAALEDDYNIGEAEDEVIPQNIPSQELRAGTVEMEIKTPILKLPSMKMQANAIPELSQQPVMNALPIVQKEQQPFATPEQVMAAISSGIKHPHYWLEGRIELTDGLALTSSQDKIHVGWVQEGSVKREGKVSISEGRYSLRVDKLEGELIAEVIDSKGFILGETNLDLEKILRERGDANQVIAIDLKLVPYSFGFRARTLSVYDTPTSKMPIAAAHVGLGRHDVNFQSDSKGKVAQETLSAKSSALLYADKGGHRETIVIADFAKEQRLRMFPEKYLTALFDSIDLPKGFRDLGVVWGQVVNHGVGVGGYRVRFPKHPEVRTFYFDMYIPMKNNTGTSADGQYAIVGLEEGNYEMEVLDSTDAVIDTKIVHVEPAAVSTVEFEVGRSKTVYIKYFDPFRTTPRAIEYVTLGGKDTATGETEANLPITAYMGDDPLLLFARTENAQVGSATFASRTHKYQEIPVLDHAWFEGIAQAYKIDTKQGAIVGFVDTQEHFDVYLDKKVMNYKVLYFDSKGQIIKANDVGRQRSGFIFYNAGVDLHTVLIETNSGQVVTELAYVDGEAVAVLFKSL